MTCFLLPGMGADQNMYQGPWRSLKNCEYLDWPSYDGEQTFKEVANRLIEKHDISKDDTVGGSSLGGMVALEIAALLETPACYLIGSAKQPDEINGLLRLLSPLSTITPITLTQILAGKSSGQVGDMYKSSDPDFIRAMCKFVSRWDPPFYHDMHIHRIHGSSDLVIPCPQEAHAIENAGHLIAMTHAYDCAKWLSGHLNA